MADFDAETELWKLANIVTGFAVAQGIAFAFALGKDLGGLQSAPVHVKCALVVVSILFAGAYSVAVQRCRKLAGATRATTQMWREVTRGRHIAIWLFTGLGTFGLFAPELVRLVG